MYQINCKKYAKFLNSDSWHVPNQATAITHDVSYMILPSDVEKCLCNPLLLAFMELFKPTKIFHRGSTGNSRKLKNANPKETENEILRSGFAAKAKRTTDSV